MHIIANAFTCGGILETKALYIQGYISFIEPTMKWWYFFNCYAMV
jgi:hypothetical protein